jgi:serine/threonine-protein kinase
MEKIGRYEIERELGHGGMAVVYLAQDPLMKRRVAIKVLPRQLTFDTQFRNRFQNEARMIASLEHPAIVPVYDFGDHEEQPYLVMRYMTGGSLQDRMGAPMAIAEISRILSILAPALDKAHERGIIHRDLKPGNILFDDDDKPYLADFGIARLAEATHTMTIAGTPSYMSPEQIQGDQELDGRSDIYALGVILFEMMSGKPPYEANTATKLMMRHILDPVPNIMDVLPGQSAAYQRIIQRVMAKKPADRYRSTVALAEEVRQLAETKTTSETMLDWPDDDLLVALPTPVGRDEATEDHLSDVLKEPIRETREQTRQEPPLPSRHVTPQPPMGRPPADIQPYSRKIPNWVIGTSVVLAVSLLAWGVAGFMGGDEDGTTPVAEIVAQATGLLEVEIPASGPTATSTDVASPTPTATPAPTDTPQPTFTPSATPLPTATLDPSVPPPNAGLHDTWLRPTDGMVMVFVPEGTFMMGSKADAPDSRDDERPVHEVKLDSFWIDRTEITNALFAAFVAETGYVTIAEQGGFGRVFTGSAFPAVPGADWRNPHGLSVDLNGREDHPVTQIAWDDANAYCSWAGATLPTEAQWEYAARGPDNFTFPWGNDYDCNLLNSDDETALDEEVVPGGVGCDGYDFTSPAGHYSPAGDSWVGATDMAGNVWEWVADWYASDYYSTLASPAENPAGADAGDLKGIRGGSWNHYARNVRSASRATDPPDNRNDTLGFRCNLVPGP